jgi:Disulphide bond corrector protein DsbC
MFKVMRRFLPLLAVCFLPLVALAAKPPGEAATITSVELKGDARPGSVVKAVVKVKLEKHFHVHSNKPSEENFIATVLTLEPLAGIKIGEIAYPKGKSVKVEGLDKPLSVYEDEFEITVTLGLSAQAKLPAVIPANLRYQACHAPQRLKLEIKLPGK